MSLVHAVFLLVCTKTKGVNEWWSDGLFEYEILDLFVEVWATEDAQASICWGWKLGCDGIFFGTGCSIAHQSGWIQSDRVENPKKLGEFFQSATSLSDSGFIFWQSLIHVNRPLSVHFFPLCQEKRYLRIIIMLNFLCVLTFCRSSLFLENPIIKGFYIVSVLSLFFFIWTE